MEFDWNAIVFAGLAALFVFGVQASVQGRIWNAAVRRYWNETAEESVKLVGQDVGGIIAALYITNALLAAILAILIIRK